MFLKRVALASVSIFALALTLEITASLARGQAIGFRVLGPGTVEAGGAVYVLDTSNSPYGWKQLPALGFTLPPVPASTLLTYDGFVAITESGEGWGKVFGTWTDLGAIPTTPVQGTTWGQVKSKYLR